MTYMKQILQEQSIYFSRLDIDKILSESKNVKYNKSSHPAFKQQPGTAKLRKSVIEAESILNDKSGYTKSKTSKAVSCLLAIIRNLGDFMMAAGGFATGFILFGPVSAIVGYVLAIIAALVSGFIIRKAADKLELMHERNNAKKVLSELKKLEKKLPKKEKAKIKAQIKKIENTLDEN